MRISLADVRQSRLAKSIGLCAGNTPEIAAAVNAATQRLINAGGETGWAGGWSKVVFSVSQLNPYITLPRKFARAVNMDVCRTPIRVHNEWYEMLPGGIGLVPTSETADWCGTIDGFERGTVPTMTDITATNQHLRAYYTDSRDIGSKLLITGLDQNGYQIYSTLGNDTVDGFAITLSAPFADGTIGGALVQVSAIQSVQKDITHGDVVLRQVDLTTGTEVTLARYAPTEVNPAYRRYQITKLPSYCCQGGASTSVSVTAICKLEFIPIYLDTDQLIIGNIEALIEECQSIRLAGMESADAIRMAGAHHNAAIKLLQDELRHYHGSQQIAVSVDPFEGCPLEDHGVGTLR